MSEKRTIFFSRPYRRLKIDIELCIADICLCIIPLLLLLIPNIPWITKTLCNISIYVFNKLAPEIYIESKMFDFSFFGKCSYLSLATTYPTVKFCFYNAVICFIILFVLLSSRLKHNPFGMYCIFNLFIQLVNCVWFIFAKDYFPYTLSEFSQTYIIQEVAIWLVFIFLAGLAIGSVGDKALFIKPFYVLGVLLFSIAFGTIRYIVFLFILYKYSMIYMALYYFTFGPLFDFMFLVVFYALFINRAVKVYSSQKGQAEWKWS